MLSVRVKALSPKMTNDAVSSPFGTHYPRFVINHARESFFVTFGLMSNQINLRSASAIAISKRETFYFRAQKQKYLFELSKASLESFCQTPHPSNAPIAPHSKYI